MLMEETQYRLNRTRDEMDYAICVVNLVRLPRHWHDDALSCNTVPSKAQQILWASGGFVAGFGKGEPLVAEVGDDLQTAAEGFDVGG